MAADLCRVLALRLDSCGGIAGPRCRGTGVDPSAFTPDVYSVSLGALTLGVAGTSLATIDRTEPWQSSNGPQFTLTPRRLASSPKRPESSRSVLAISA